MQDHFRSCHEGCYPGKQICRLSDQYNCEYFPRPFPTLEVITCLSSAPSAPGITESYLVNIWQFWVLCTFSF
ncbi:unnamed protein product [Tuber melanosporum]|uniref:(Perigord truffle) hypothetical protein n=1 Tax=Tuber melanosporum (strain Mel28) TaxID=656061 RepID=D5GN83_TUBMM|nr:uncharacterized protein GSTUM_00011151001 [Tuber melanosporum]CAZ85976.1 unnamed protein product [Tuber melanosporum]